MLEIVKVSAKYRITIPYSVKTRLDLVKGDRLFFGENNGVVAIGKIRCLHGQYLVSVSHTIEDEWFSEADEAAYGDL